MRVSARRDMQFMQWWAREIKENVRQNGKGRKLYKW